MSNKMTRAMKKSAEGLTETYTNENGNRMAIMQDAAGHVVHTPVAFLVATTYIPNPLGCIEVGFKDGDRSNLNADNLYWLTPEEVKQIQDEHKSTGGVAESGPGE